MLHPWVLSDTAQAGRLSKEAERKKHAKKGKEKGKKERKKRRETSLPLEEYRVNIQPSLSINIV